MAEPRREAQKGFWERADTRIGVLSSFVGLLVAVLGVPAMIDDLFGGSDSDESEVAALELEQKRAKVAAAGPRLDVSYVFMTEDLVGQDLFQSGGKREGPNAARTIRSYPIVQNEILNGLNTGSGPDTKGCGIRGFAEPSVAFLVVNNRGRRDAASVVVQVQRLELSGTVPVSESAVGGDDYVEKLHAQTAGRAPVTVRVPQTLGPGEGVRVPLFVSAAPPERYDKWCVVSRTAFEPRSVRFMDPVLDARKRSKVRRLANPVRLASGVVGRG